MHGVVRRSASVRDVEGTLGCKLWEPGTVATSGKDCGLQKQRARTSVQHERMLIHPMDNNNDRTNIKNDGANKNDGAEFSVQHYAHVDS